MTTYRAFAAMSNEELLQVLIREKEGDNTVQELLARHQSLPDLFVHADIEELLQVKGIGLHKAQLIKAVFQLAQRLNQWDQHQPVRIKNPDDVAALLQDDLAHLQKETFLVLLLNTKHVVTHKEVVSVGTLNASLVHPREVFGPAVRKSASGIICVHNHPSGDPSPSKEDIAITKRLIEAGEILGIGVLDHIVLAGSQYTSLREDGAVTF